MLGYHIDSARTLSLYQAIGLMHYIGHFPDDLQQEISFHHPRGIGLWGFRCLQELLSISDPLIHTQSQHNALVERDVEYVRRKRFPHLLSRYECFFAAESIDILTGCWGRLLGRDAPVWEIHSEREGRRFDASFLDGLPVQVSSLPDDNSAAFEQICRYWEGRFSSSPKPELLLPLPSVATARLFL